MNEPFIKIKPEEMAILSEQLDQLLLRPAAKVNQVLSTLGARFQAENPPVQSNEESKSKVLQKEENIEPLPPKAEEVNLGLPKEEKKDVGRNNK